MPTLRTSDDTYEWLDKRRAPGQSFDGALREIRRELDESPDENQDTAGESVEARTL